MSAGPIAAQRAAWEPEQPSRFRVGMLVTCLLTPPGHRHWRIVEIDGGIALLETTSECPVSRIKRRLSTLQIEKEKTYA
jgi:hypothetical protein